MDLTESIAPKSDQINADDLMTGPITATIKEVRKGAGEQPVDVILEEFPGRAYRPSKSMRRVMVSAWGAEASNYTGRKLTLFRNPEIAFGGIKLGGIEIASMSHIDKPLTVALTTTRSKRKNFTVTPLVTTAPVDTAPTLEEATVSEWVSTLNAADTLQALQSAWGDATKNGVTRHPEILAAKEKRKGELS